ncbi:class I SAM-dependent methyltransferase [Vannielia litorea]|uniref:Phosphatidylethanolamine N-methyltransferase /phosphatidyl-N-methylethanolamine N-methyltransferase n=1 Tax=Vannielia litorea TaxID=1217970 RepID=A0A1N6EHM5_9RHOB|nr:class I SAM-dependent methyltransferase [Vannielia litorea]SIN82496.1 phosphatidylethanolamine N-methyltransferase /phosphatidyl-N-methylethanolamine N-methyltransferase [Vannielia litorea]
MKIEAVSNTYKRWAPVYDSTFGAVTNAGRKRATSYVTERGGDVLEVGVGTGLALPLYGPGVRVTGIDFSPEMLAKAERRVQEEGLSRVVALRQMDARELDFPDASFDYVSAMHVLSVVPEPERVMREIARVLRPGGQVLIVNHFAADKGVLGLVERAIAPLEGLIGWHSDFPISRVLGAQGLVEVERDSLPPMRIMSWLVLEKQG